VCANDGIVTVRSARWGTFMGCFPADHFDEVGQVAMKKPNPESGYDQRVFYENVVQHIREEGFQRTGAVREVEESLDSSGPFRWKAESGHVRGASPAAPRPRSPCADGPN
jgi:hypothetical protein